MAEYFRIQERNEKTKQVENVYVFETYKGVRNFAMNFEKKDKDYVFETAKQA